MAPAATVSGGLLRGLARRGSRGPEPVAAGVWRLQGNPGRLNVYLLDDGDGLVLFDAGGRMMVDQIEAAARHLGPITMIVLGHAHTDHRGAAPYLNAPVLCHPDERADAEGSGGFRYWSKDLAELPQPRRFVQREILHPRFWDGGPVEIADTVEEGDEIAGFRVVHFPGHAPGQIALVRDLDRIALTTDIFYTIDAWGRDAAPSVPDDAWNWDPAMARDAVARLAGLGIETAWPGHGEPLRGQIGPRLTEAVREHKRASAAHGGRRRSQRGPELAAEAEPPG